MAAAREVEAPVERFVAPTAVLLLHALLLGDVVAHQRRLLDVSAPLVRLEWLVALVAVLAYLRTVCSDPGFLRPEGSGFAPGKGPGRSIAAIAWVLALPAGLFLRLAAIWRGSSSTASSEVGPSGAAVDRARIRERDSRELQPIGRAALDALGGAEADSDPGEETLDPADLESGGGAAALAALRGQGGETGEAKSGGAPPSAGAGNGARRDRAPGGKYQGASLGAVPGSPRPGYQVHRKRGGTGGAAAAAERGREVLQSGQRLLFCRVCELHQPLRTKHCRECGRCVRTHDHHCPWVGTCIGEGNRAYFFSFLALQGVELAIFFLEGCLALVGSSRLGAVAAMLTNPGLVLGLVAIGFLLIMVSCLLCFHSYLALSNMTTWENLSWRNITYLRNINPEEGSPFSVSLRANLAAYFCSPSWLKRTEDGWAVWEIVEDRGGSRHPPLELDCSRFALVPCAWLGVEDPGHCRPCACFDAG